MFSLCRNFLLLGKCAATNSHGSYCKINYSFLECLQSIVFRGMALFYIYIYMYIVVHVCPVRLDMRCRRTCMNAHDYGNNGQSGGTEHYFYL